MTEFLIGGTVLIFGMVCIAFIAKNSMPYFFGLIVWVAYTFFLVLLVLISGMGSNSAGMEYIVFVIYITSGITAMYFLSKQATGMQKNSSAHAAITHEDKSVIYDVNDNLVTAVTNNDIKAVANCLALGANPNKVNKTGYSAIDYARGHGYSDIRDVLELNLKNRSS